MAARVPTKNSTTVRSAVWWRFSDTDHRRRRRCDERPVDAGGSSGRRCFQRQQWSSTAPPVAAGGCSAMAGVGDRRSSSRNPNPSLTAIKTLPNYISPSKVR